MPTITEKAMLVKLSISQWTARKEDKKITKEVNDNHNATDAGRYHKHLLAKEALEAIQKNVNEARTYHYSVTLPWNIDGLDILPSALYFEYSQKMGKFKTDHENHVREFINNFPQYVDSARARLNGLFNAADYPTVTELKRKFSFSVQYYPVPTAGDFRVSLNEEEMTRIKETLTQQIKTMEQEAIKSLWARLHAAVSRMAERLGDPDAIFKNSLVSNIAELVSLLPRLNFADDPALETVRQDVEKKLTKFSPDTLREDEHARRETANAAREILKTINPNLNDAPQEPAPPTTPQPAPTVIDTRAKLEAIGETLF